MGCDTPWEPAGRVRRVRPLRFGLSVHGAGSAAEFAALARRAEDAGYSTLLVPDHLGHLSPMVACAVAAGATARLRVGPFVLNNDFRHPVLVAQEAATLDLLSGGRLELGLGAGHARGEYEAAGWDFDRAQVRIDRLAESARVLRRLFAGEEVTHAGRHYRISAHRLAPAPPQGAALPILVGGNGDRLLALAATAADIVGFTGFSPGPALDHFDAAGLDNRIAVVRRAAGTRFDELELNLLVQRVVITDDRPAALRRLAADFELPRQQLDDSPFVLVGTVAEITARVQNLRERHGVSYLTVFEGRSAGFDAVVKRLASTS